MHPDVRYVLTVAGWSLFWILVVLGVAGLVMEWQALERLTGL